MSAECHKCGADLDYYLNCARCQQRERAEKAEARQADLEVALGFYAAMDGTVQALAAISQDGGKTARAALNAPPALYREGAGR